MVRMSAVESACNDLEQGGVKVKISANNVTMEDKKSISESIVTRVIVVSCTHRVGRGLRLPRKAKAKVEKVKAAKARMTRTGGQFVKPRAAAKLVLMISASRVIVKVWNAVASWTRAATKGRLAIVIQRNVCYRLYSKSWRT